jgi:PHD/YefM family antitoxin component YafN of YafNO toxin-antitoxin module
MKTMTIEQVNQDISSVINYSLNTHDEVNIATDSGAVIIIPQEDYDSMQETLRLLMDKKSLSALLQGHINRDSGNLSKSYSIKDVFGDL